MRLEQHSIIQKQTIKPNGICCQIKKIIIYILTILNIMRKFYAILAVMLAAVSFTSCDLCTVDGGEEGVFIKQPWFFGEGGVVEEPLTKGSAWKVWSDRKSVV